MISAKDDSRAVALTPLTLARAYGIPHVIDYGPDRDGGGLLISLGAGLMMAGMDQLPWCRWAVDIGPSRGRPEAISWSEAVSHVVPWAVAHLWLSISSPDWARDLVAAWPKYRIAYWANADLGRGRQDNMTQLTACARLMHALYDDR